MPEPESGISSCGMGSSPILSKLVPEHPGVFGPGCFRVRMWPFYPGPPPFLFAGDKVDYRSLFGVSIARLAMAVIWGVPTGEEKTKTMIVISYNQSRAKEMKSS